METIEPDIKNIIQHEGIVEKTDKGSVMVRITSVSACSGCHAEGSCSMTGKEDKLIMITGNYNVSEGDCVTVMMRKSMGYRAVFLGYVLPFFSVLIMLVFLNSTGFSELTAGLLSLSVLIPYYALLFLIRKKIDKEFIFTLKS